MPSWLAAKAQPETERIREAVTFGRYEPFNTKPAVCAFGEVTPMAVVVNVGGNTWEGSCYTSG
jgi:hypothetical protein